MSPEPAAGDVPASDAGRQRLGDLLAEMWSDERCDWRIEHHGSPWNKTDDPFVVLLEWTQEYGNQHDADWTTFTWQFYGATADEAMAGALAWCSMLAPWKRCDACDGTPNPHRPEPCEECAGSGLAYADLLIEAENALADAASGPTAVSPPPHPWPEVSKGTRLTGEFKVKEAGNG